MDVRIEHLSKSYGLQKAVDDISFHVKQGEVVGFLGPNGAGKTTTMKIITDYLEMDSGEVFIGGVSVRSGDMRKHIGYLPENNPLYDDMPVIDYLEYCGRMQGLNVELVQRRIREMVRMCGLDPEKHKKINELSKGYRQRVGLAQAMIHDPDVLILDEPTTGLDPNQRVEIRDLIKSLGRQKTVILSTHILPEVEATCDRILIINRGRIVADGEVGALKQQAAGGQMIHVSIEDAVHEDIVPALGSLPGVTNISVRDAGRLQYDVHCQHAVNPSRMIYELCVRKNWILTELTPVETKLEDVFRDLTMN